MTKPDDDQHVAETSYPAALIVVLVIRSGHGARHERTICLSERVLLHVLVVQLDASPIGGGWAQRHQGVDLG
jgi:hypothetical protein